MQVGVLGPLEVSVAGERVRVGGPKEQAVLAALALRSGETVTAAQLIADLWGEEPPRSAGKTLQTYVSHLRRVLPEGAIVTAGAGYRLDVDGDAIDAVRFERLVARGSSELAAGAFGDAAATLDEALAGWRGEPLAELDDVPVVAAEAVRLTEVRLVAVEARVDAGLALGDGARLVGDLQRLVRAHPTRERLWGQLMLALNQSGRQADALRTYQVARRHLLEAAGVEPGDGLRRIERALLDRDPSVLAPPGTNSVATTTVTILLTDIESSTAHWESDHERMARAVARHETIIRDAVCTCTGSIVKDRGEGDSTFSVFERATDAVACAVDVQRSIAREVWDTTTPVRIRVGIHTGEVQVRDGDYYGRAINRAARLRGLASGGQVLLSAATAALVADDLPDGVQLVDLGEHVLRDIVRPERVHGLRASGLAEPAVAGRARVPLPPPIAASCAQPMLGRQAELERVLAGCAHDAATRSRRLVLIAGEPGIGKSRLAAEAACRLHADGAVVVHGRCDEEALAPYQPFTEALTALGTARGRDLGADVQILLGGSDESRPSTPGALEGARWKLFEAVSDVLEDAASAAPLVLVIDDLHWADGPTLALVRHVLRRGAGAPVAVLATYRDTDVDRTRPLSGALAELALLPALERVALGRLDPRSVLELAARHGLAVDRQDTPLDDLAGGNPFFVIELARHLGETPTGSIDRVGAPQGVRDVIGRRLDRLPGPSDRILATAAVMGREFDVAVVADATSSDLEDVLAVARAGAAARLLEEDRSVPGRFAFAHALVRETLLDELGVTARVFAHRRVAEAIEQCPGGRTAAAAELAHHYGEAAATGCADRALGWARHAAEDALGRLAHEEAAAHLERALTAADLLDAPSGLRVELLVERGRQLWLAGAGRASRDTLRRAVELARDAGDPVGFASAAIEAAQGWYGRAWDDDIALLDEALEQIDRSAQPILHARLLAQLCRRLTFVDDERLVLVAPVAVDAARAVGDAWALRNALHGLLLVTFPTATEAETEALLDQAEAVSEGLGGVSRAEVRLVRIAFLLERRDRTAVDAEVAALERSVEAHRLPLEAFYLASVRATLAVLDTSPTAAAAIDEAEQVGMESLGAMASLLCGIQRVHLALATGEVGPLVEFTETEAKQWTERHLPGFAIITALLRCHTGQLDRVRETLDRFDAIGFGRLPRNIDTVAYWVWLADLVQAVGTPQQAQRLAEAMAPLRGRVGTTVGATGSPGSIDHALGVCALLNGDAGSAIDLFEAAEAVHRDRLRSPGLAARSRVERAAALVMRDGDGDRATAAALATDALDVADRYGLGPLARRARIVLADAARPPFPAPLVARSPILGREDELRAAREWLAEADAPERLLLVSGEPGIGKTRLAAAIALERHELGDVVVFGRCDEEAPGPYQPITEALRSWPVVRDGAALERALPDHVVMLRRILPELGAVPGDEVVDRRPLLDAAGAAFAALGGSRRVLLVVDDLHWADAATLGLLRHLLRSPQLPDLRVLGTYRDTDLDRSRPLASMLAELWRGGPPTRIPLRGLDRDAVAAMLGAAASSVDRVVAETDGNPLFVSLVARQLQDSDALGTSRLPEGVREVIGHRVDALPDGADRVLVAAAVAGKEFDLDVAAAAAEVTEEAALSAVEAGIRAGLLVELPDRPDRFAFAHALVARTLRDALVTSRRVRLHRGVARAIAARPDAAQRVAELALHYGEAAAAGCLQEAIEHTRLAGQQAFERLAFEQAAAHFRNALEFVDLHPDPDESVRAQLLLRLGRALQHCGEPRAAAARLGDAIAAARKAGDAQTFARAAIERTNWGAALDGERTEDDDILDEAAELARGDAGLRARVLAEHVRWRTLWPTDALRAMSEEAVSLARRSGDPSALALAMAVSVWLTSDVGGGEAVLEEARAARLAGGLDWQDELVFLQLGTVAALARGDFERAREHTARHLDLVGDSPSARARLSRSLIETVWATIEGPPDRAEALAARTLELGRGVDPTEWVPLAVHATQELVIRYLQGRVGELVEAIEQHFHMIETPVPAWWSALALARAGRGDVDGSRACVAALLAHDVDELPKRADWGPIVFHLGEVCAVTGDARTAELIYRRARSRSGTMCIFSGYLFLGAYDHHLGRLATAAGGIDVARGHLLAAVAQYERLGALPWLHRARGALDALR